LKKYSIIALHPREVFDDPYADKFPGAIMLSEQDYDKALEQYTQVR